MPFDSKYHAPVLVAEATELLRQCRVVLDGTLGGGGHTAALLAAGVGSVVGLDRDSDALAEATTRLQSFAAAGRVTAMQANFAELDGVPALEGIRFDGVLLDLGVSSHQFDAPERGFTFRPGASLDMRMDRAPDRSTGADLLNGEDAKVLADIFRDLADEPRAKGLAAEIVRRRANRPFAISDDLVGAIRAVLGARSGPSEFARLFQALRIAVNDELGALARALPALRDRLTPGGRLVVITYHSGEDRLVKHAFRDWSAACVCPPKQPVCTCRGHALGQTITRRPLVPSSDEVAQNVRARSAKLRAWQSNG